MFLPDNTIYVPVADPDMSNVRTPNHRIDMNSRLNTYQEIDQTYTEEEALQEASRCLGCPTHWCQNACPAGVPVTDFIARVREKDYEGAYRLISERSSLSEICSRLCPQEKQCQSNCTRGICGTSVGIGRIERFVSDWHRKYGKEPPAAERNGLKVAVVGAGPGGLGAAQRLCSKGYEVTVFDKDTQAGGLLNHGIPGMKLDKTVLRRKIDSIAASGVTFVYDCQVDEKAAVQIKEDFDAVVLAVGTEECRMPQIEGMESAKGIVFAVNYLNSKEITANDKHVIIVGGGDTGNDCVGMALRDGCRSLVQIEMLPKHKPHEVICFPYGHQKQEIKFDCSQEEYLYKFCRDPHYYESVVKKVSTDDQGKIQSALIKHLGSGKEVAMPCDLLIIAAGFTGPKQNIKTDFKVDFTAGYQTSDQNIFACGDCRTGQSLVVKAMVDGQKCADAVDDFLRGKQDV